jgi:tRNA(Arg) A34 adenosine deaminase TadA
MDAQNKYMIEALAEAKRAAEAGEVPVGALLVDGTTGEVVARSGNRTERDHDATAHAEILVIKRGGQVYGTPRLVNCDLYVTLEPCPMCAAAISLARLRRVYYGAYDPKSGGVDHGPRVFTHPTCHHVPELYGGMHEAECGAILKDFFKDKR